MFGFKLVTFFIFIDFIRFFYLQEREERARSARCIVNLKDRVCRAQSAQQEDVMRPVRTQFPKLGGFVKIIMFAREAREERG